MSGFWFSLVRFFSGCTLLFLVSVLFLRSNTGRQHDVSSLGLHGREKLKFSLFKPVSCCLSLFSHSVHCFNWIRLCRLCVACAETSRALPCTLPWVLSIADFGYVCCISICQTSLRISHQCRVPSVETSSHQTVCGRRIHAGDI